MAVASCGLAAGREDLPRHGRDAGKSMLGFKRIGMAALLAFALVLWRRP
jgi:hypothetical protein